ncbi:hypothetical protein AAFF_G00186610 [Aldrovandia affinis]|uniref:Uncharacterized protein n=1 Tax=Aldrovandia affinis TaxID=143900 RepID=A0AAD7SXP6_9TELE|nr:hypothetical protein AAFF_G00186610 [Aldrovandia affinis]
MKRSKSTGRKISLDQRHGISITLNVPGKSLRSLMRGRGEKEKTVTWMPKENEGMERERVDEKEDTEKEKKLMMRKEKEEMERERMRERDEFEKERAKMREDNEEMVRELEKGRAETVKLSCLLELAEIDVEMMATEWTREREQWRRRMKKLGRTARVTIVNPLQSSVTITPKTAPEGTLPFAFMPGRQGQLYTSSYPLVALPAKRHRTLAARHQ